MNIVCTIDERYAQHCGVMLCSLFRNNPDSIFRVFVVSSGLTDVSRRNLRRVSRDARHELEFVDVDPRLTESVQVSGHVSIAGYFRFLIPEVLPGDVDKALFLDSDLIVRGPVTELYDQRLDVYTHAAVVNPLCGPVHRAIPASLGIPDGSPYFNSGVMLINVGRWRDERLSSRVVEYFKANVARFRSWHHEPLNAVLHGRWRNCHPIWNAQEAYFLGRSPAQLGIADEELVRITANPRVVHFTGTSKPWSYYHVHPYGREYFKYLGLTPWKGYKPVDRPAAHVRARLLASRFAPEVIKRSFRRFRQGDSASQTVS